MYTELKNKIEDAQTISELDTCYDAARHASEELRRRANNYSKVTPYSSNLSITKIIKKAIIRESEAFSELAHIALRHKDALLDNIETKQKIERDLQRIQGRIIQLQNGDDFLYTNRSGNLIEFNELKRQRDDLRDWLSHYRQYGE